MAIYSRWGSIINPVRMATEADVKTLDKRKPDKHDRERIRLGMFVVATSADEKKNVDFVERIHEVAWLRADGGIHEIDEALKPLRLTTQAGNG